MRTRGARGDSPAFCRRLPRQPTKPRKGSWPLSRVLRSLGRRERRGARFVVRSRRARGKSERAARLVLLVEAAAAAEPPDGPSASHRLWVTDTHSEGGEGTSRRAGRREGTGQGHREGRGRDAEWSLGSCSFPTEEKRETSSMRMLPGSLCTAHARGVAGWRGERLRD